MSIEVPVLEVFDLADRLRAAGRSGAVAAALDDALDAYRTLARALAVESEDLGDAVDAVGRSWMALDAGLLARRGQVMER